MTTMSLTPTQTTEKRTGRVVSSSSFDGVILRRGIHAPREYVVVRIEKASAAQRDEVLRVWSATNGAAGSFQWMAPERAEVETYRFSSSELSITQQSAVDLYDVEFELERLYR
jgi:hypothetical protein